MNKVTAVYKTKEIYIVDVDETFVNNIKYKSDYIYVFRNCRLFI